VGGRQKGQRVGGNQLKGAGLGVGCDKKSGRKERETRSNQADRKAHAQAAPASGWIARGMKEGALTDASSGELSGSR